MPLPILLKLGNDPIFTPKEAGDVERKGRTCDPEPNDIGAKKTPDPLKSRDGTPRDNHDGQQSPQGKKRYESQPDLPHPYHRPPSTYKRRFSHEPTEATVDALSTERPIRKSAGKLAPASRPKDGKRNHRHQHATQGNNQRAPAIGVHREEELHARLDTIDHDPLRPGWIYSRDSRLAPKLQLGRALVLEAPASRPAEQESGNADGHLDIVSADNKNRKR